MDRSRAVVSVLLVCSLASAGLAATPAAAASNPSIVRTTTLSLTPSRPGSVGATVEYALPDSLRSLRVRLPSAASVDATRGFERVDADTYAWDGTTDAPRLRLTVAANESATTVPIAGDHADAADPPAAGYAFVDVGPWAIVRVPSFGTEWSYAGERVTFERRTRVDGAGVAGTDVAYLGPGEWTSRTVDGQTITLAVPAAANLRADRADLLSALASAADELRVGDRDPRVLAVAAPTSVTWGVLGLQAGDADFWVLADRPVGTPDSVWLHEYVHTRQAFRTDSSGRWLTEATAEYLAAALALRQGRTDFGAFADHLERGREAIYEGSVLSRPETWGYLANYQKGALVAGEIDRRVRLASDHRRSLLDVFARLNECDAAGTCASDPVSNADVLRAVESVAPSVRSTAEQYTTTTATPAMWSARDHERAFGVDPPQVRYHIRSWDVSGPYRKASSASVPTLVPGETLTLRVDVANVGSTPGPYNATLRVDGPVVDWRAGTVGPGETREVALSHAFDEVGRRVVRLGENETGLRVQPLADLTVTDLRADRTTLRPGETVRVAVDVASAAAWPGAGTVAVTVDGRPVAERTLTASGDGSQTLAVDVTIDDPGDHVVRAGDRSLTLSVADPTTTTGTTAPPSTATTTTTGQGGLGPLVALLVALSALGALAHRR